MNPNATGARRIPPTIHRHRRARPTRTIRTHSRRIIRPIQGAGGDRVEGDPHVHRDGEFSALDHERLAKCLDHAAGDDRRIVRGLDLGGNKRELVSTEPPQRVTPVR